MDSPGPKADVARRAGGEMVVVKGEGGVGESLDTAGPL